jgi:hypothetical protein
MRFIVLLTAILLLVTNQRISAQEQYPDKLYPRSEKWSVNCRVLRIAEKTVIVLFPKQEKPVEIYRTSLKKIEFEDGRQISFNQYGQIEGEIIAPRTVHVKDVLNLGIVRLDNGEEVVLNGIDYSLPSDTTLLRFFYKGAEYVQSLILNQTVTLQFDLQQRDNFGRLLAYVILPGGIMLNAEIIKRGFCKADTTRFLLYLEDFKALESEAQQEKRGIWGVKKE